MEKYVSDKSTFSSNRVYVLPNSRLDKVHGTKTCAEKGWVMAAVKTKHLGMSMKEWVHVDFHFYIKTNRTPEGVKGAWR